MKILIATLITASIATAQIPFLSPGKDTVRVSTTSALVSAISTAPKGRTILLSDGTYNLATVWPLRFKVDSVTLYGASRDPSKVILRGAGFTSSNPDEELIKVEAKALTFAYFTLRDGRGNGLKIQTGANHNLLVHNVYFIDICERSIKGPEAPISLGGVIRYCRFEQVTAITSSIPNLNGGGDYIAGMDMMRIENWKIHDNVFKNIRGMNGGGRAAVFLWNMCKNVSIERNLFQGNDRAIALGNPLNTVVGMDSGSVRGNFIVAGKNISLEICNSSGVSIEDNTIYSTNPLYARTIQTMNNGTNSFQRNRVVGNINHSSGVPLDVTGNHFVNDAGISGDLFFPLSAPITKIVPAPYPETVLVKIPVPYPESVFVAGPVEVKVETSFVYPKKRVSTIITTTTNTEVFE